LESCPLHIAKIAEVVMKRRRAVWEALPCLEVPMFEPNSLSDRHKRNKEGLRALPFSGLKASPNFQRICTSIH
jgi:hypothetical protein